MKRLGLLWLVSILLLYSCNPLEYFKYYKVHLKIQDLSELKKGAIVVASSHEIGEVVEIVKQIEEQEADSINVVTIKVQKDFLIPVNSEIRVISDIGSGAAHIEIAPSHSRRNHSFGDTIHSGGMIIFNKDLQLMEVEIPIDSLPEGIQVLM
ncbi:MAG TPA: hypothetical protein VFD65_04895 [Chitinophagales bacterium]|nr:hypothetical protein [Chitinophagales bacterium]